MDVQGSAEAAVTEAALWDVVDQLNLTTIVWESSTPWPTILDVSDFWVNVFDPLYLLYTDATDSEGYHFIQAHALTRT